MDRRKILFFFFPAICLFARQGLEYTYFTESQSIHVLEVDPVLYAIRPAKALDDGLGRESVLSLSVRYGALASINGGFFSIGGTFDGKACGALKIVDWYALPFKPRGCIGWSLIDPQPKMDRLLVSIELKDRERTILLDGLNRPRKEGEMILFTPCFHKTTLTNPDGEEVVVINGIIQTVVKGGSANIPDNGYVLSIQQTHPLFGAFAIRMPVAISTQIRSLTGFTSPEEWDVLDFIVGGTPLLLHHGIRIQDIESEETRPTFLTNRHARTAVGLLSNGHWVFVVVDKLGFWDFWGGMTIDELTDFMARLGCVYALNLDGGGSSTMVYEGVIRNTPYGDEDEGAGGQTVRRVSDAILVLPRH